MLKACYSGKSFYPCLVKLYFRAETGYIERSKSEMTTKFVPASKQGGKMEGQPRLQHHSREIQAYDQIRSMPIGLPEKAVRQSVTMLNQLLADSITLYAL